MIGALRRFLCCSSSLFVVSLLLTYRFPSGHMTFIQRRLNVDATSSRYVSAGWLYHCEPSRERMTLRTFHGIKFSKCMLNAVARFHV